jgi:hypothetical protein
MEDIGLNPDYRSGVPDSGPCELCGREWYVDRLETCTECGRTVCPDCGEDQMVRFVCDDCLDDILDL